MTKWGEDIPMDVAIKILEHLHFHDDFIAFKSVCNRWRSAAKEAKFRACVSTKSLPWSSSSSSSSSSLALSHDHHHLPWLIVSDPLNYPEHDPHCSVYSLCHCTIRHLEIPPSPQQPQQQQQLLLQGLILSSCGWLLSVTTELVDPQETNISLFNPFSGTLVQLPTLEIWSQTMHEVVPFKHDVILFKKFILSSKTHNNDDDDYSVTLILQEPHLHLSSQSEIVVSWKRGDDHWVQLGVLKTGTGYDWVPFLKFCCDISFYRGDFYVVDGNGDLFAFRPGQSCLRIVARFQNQGVFDWTDVYDSTQIFYLVESLGRLLLLCRVRDNESFETLSFQVFDVNVENGDAKEVCNLGGNRAVFVGTNSSFSVEPSPAHGCKPNRIYYTDDYRHLYFDSLRNYDIMGKDYGVYNLITEEIECFTNDIGSLSTDYAPSMWLESPAS